MSDGLKVMGGRVLVKPIEKVTASASGIVLTDKEPPTFGRVVAIGSKHRCSECATPIPIELRIGVIVGFSATAGQDVTMNGETYTILRLDDVQFEWTPETAQESV
jgi:co-chaperonin GroES (HSP10)